MKLEYFFLLQSSIVFGILTWGLVKRKETKLHSKLMKFAIIWDLLLVAQIELKNNAINQTMNFTDNVWLLRYHIVIAVLCVVGYFFLLYSGSQLLKGNKKLRRYHVPVGVVTYLFRLSTFITSFWVQDL